MRSLSAKTPMKSSFGSGRRVVGLMVASIITLTIMGIFTAIQRTSLTAPRSIPIDVFHLLRMTTIQAGLTTILSLTVGILLAWTLNRLKFPGRNAVAGLFAAAIVTPGLVVAVGLLSVWGRSGWINQFLGLFSLEMPGSIFGLHGILAAHVILDGTFAARILLSRLDAIPDIQIKTGQSLNLGPLKRFQTLDWPAMSSAMPGLGAIIFLLAFTSFPIVLLLGGGPANQTLEVAIYSAVRLNFDLGGAVQLALIQLFVCALIILPAISFTSSIAGAGGHTQYYWPDRPAIRLLQKIILTLGIIGFLLPLLAVLVDGIGPDLAALATKSSFWRATMSSLLVGSLSALLTLSLALTLCLARAEVSNRYLRALLNLPAYTYLIVPAIVLSLGFFITSRMLGISASRAAPFVLIFANALLALPFAISTLGPPIAAINQNYRRLTLSLNLTGYGRWKKIEWPLLGREIGLVLALGFCFSLGDLAVISLFGTEKFSTLPWLMMRAMGAYRTGDAAAIAAILLILAFTTFWILPPLMRKWADAQN